MEKDMRFKNHAVAIVTIVAASGFPVFGQSERSATQLAQAEPPAANPSPAPFDRRDCPSGQSNSAPRSSETTGSRSLSDQLSQSKGVICPPAGVDPGITVPPVGGGRTPVIPPPGTPGGDPNVVPKQ
jgi:hypothetical protein